MFGSGPCTSFSGIWVFSNSLALDRMRGLRAAVDNAFSVPFCVDWLSLLQCDYVVDFGLWRSLRFLFFDV